MDALGSQAVVTVEGYSTMLTLFGKLAADKDLKTLDLWWNNQGERNATTDKPVVREATLYGDRQALTWTAAVPATMAVGYLLLILYFRFTGGYKQVHIAEEPKVPGTWAARRPCRHRRPTVTKRESRTASPAKAWNRRRSDRRTTSRFIVLRNDKSGNGDWTTIISPR